MKFATAIVPEDILVTLTLHIMQMIIFFNVKCTTKLLTYFV